MLANEVMKTRDTDYTLLHHRVCDGETGDNHTVNSDDHVLGLGGSMCKDLDLNLSPSHRLKHTYLPLNV